MWKAWRRIPNDIDSEYEKQLREVPLEKGDLPAMLLASVITVFLPVLLILLLLGGACYLLFVWL